MTGPTARLLPDGRLHLQHGPIDLIVAAFGAPEAVRAALTRATDRLQGLLAALAAELPALRSPDPGPLTDPVARAMATATAPFRPAFITPMAAVAGAVADAVLAALAETPGLTRAYVNNGGDIALHLTPGHTLAAAIATPDGRLLGRVTTAFADPVRGLATSGWPGRSFSLGIADAVTVAAATAAMADAAATMIANAVDLPGHPGVRRRPAAEMQADSDLGPRLVTTAVAPLSPVDRARALAAGLAAAEAFRARGLIAGAALFLQGEARIAGQIALLPTEGPEP